MKDERKFSYKRFRTAAYITIVGSAVWTIAIILPFAPFSYLPPLMIGGGPGTWFLLAYILYVAVGIGGIGALSAFLFAIETYERRILNDSIMLPGLVLLYLGMTLGCVLLGIAGAVGGYALTVQHSTVNATQTLLSPFVNPITLASLGAVAGAGLSVYGMVTGSKGPPN